MPRIKDEICVYMCLSDNSEKCIPEAYLSGANYNITIRHKACWSQLELGFNWTALIGLLHLEVELDVAVKSRCEVCRAGSEMQQRASELARELAPGPGDLPST